MAIVVRSPLVRGALTALSWLVADESPRTHVATRAEGIEWCCSLLDRKGIASSPELLVLRRDGETTSVEEKTRAS